MDYGDTLKQKTSITLKPEYAKFLKDNNLSASIVTEEAIMDRMNGFKKKDVDKKIEYVKNKIILVFIGIIALAVSGFRSINPNIAIVFMVAGLLLIFYSIFDMCLKMFKMVMKKT